VGDVASREQGPRPREPSVRQRYAAGQCRPQRRCFGWPRCSRQGGQRRASAMGVFAHRGLAAITTNGRDVLMHLTTITHKGSMTSITPATGDMNELEISHICPHRHDRRYRGDSDGRLRAWLWGHWSTGLTGHMETNLKTVQEDRRPMANGRRDFDREFFRWHRHRRHLVRPLIKGPGPVVPGFNIRPAVAQ
jgi:hypothetical protein